MDLKQHIRHVPDFPKAGILFYDITTLLRNPAGLEATIDRLSEPYLKSPIDLVIGIRVSEDVERDGLDLGLHGETVQ